MLRTCDADDPDVQSFRYALGGKGPETSRFSSLGGGAIILVLFSVAFILLAGELQNEDISALLDVEAVPPLGM